MLIASQAGRQTPRAKKQHGMGSDSWGPSRNATRGLTRASGCDTKGMSVTGRVKSNVGIGERSHTPPRIIKDLKPVVTNDRMETGGRI